MKKKIRFVLMSALVGGVCVIMASCFIFPFSAVTGEWEITGGDYSVKYGNGNKVTGDFTDGELNIEDQAFDMTGEVEATYDFDGGGEDDLVIKTDGDGYVTINSQEKYITLFFDSFSSEEVWEEFDWNDDTVEEEQMSVTYSYEIKGKEMTLSREYTSKYEGDTLEDREETIELERK